MALFGRKKEEAKGKSKAKNATKKPPAKLPAPDRKVLIGMRVTEKAVMGTAENVYVFDVAPHATKREIVNAVNVEHGVTPVAVRTSKISKKRVYRKGGWGVKGGGKKAYVTLKKGDEISVA